jgi:DtxR family Mn-dependent transcriptional regulator
MALLIENLAEDESVTSAVENYTKAIYALEHEGEGRVNNNALADRLGVTAGSASAMVKRLADLGLVEHVPYAGVALSERGERIALEVIRRHRLLELFLAEHLGVPWDRVHDEAEALEHAVSKDLEARIAEKLGNPTHDPHGHPIPDADLVIHEQRTVSLAVLEPGATGRLVRVSDSDPRMLRYLADRAVRIGDRFEVLDRQPFAGPVTVRFGDEVLVLGGALVDAMHVTLG